MKAGSATAAKKASTHGSGVEALYVPTAFCGPASRGRNCWKLMD